MGNRACTQISTLIATLRKNAGQGMYGVRDVRTYRETPLYGSLGHRACGRGESAGVRRERRSEALWGAGRRCVGKSVRVDGGTRLRARGTGVLVVQRGVEP